MNRIERSPEDPAGWFPGFRQETRHVNGVDIHYRIGGRGPGLLMLHGYPQTHIMWRHIAPCLSQFYTVICSDLRGYGDSSTPQTTDDHAPYSFREMAKDQVQLMDSLGFDHFCLIGHDRGARVSHRLCLDHPERVERVALLDICPTLTMYEATNKRFASSYYHWFFLIQPSPVPETLIGANPEFYLRTIFDKWGTKAPMKEEAAIKEYLRCFSNPDVIHATCEDYRAAANIDLDQDRADLNTRLKMPVHVIWGAAGVVGTQFDPLKEWQDRADSVSGDCVPGGHWMAEVYPEETCASLVTFLHQ